MGSAADAVLHCKYKVDRWTMPNHDRVCDRALDPAVHLMFAVISRPRK